MIRPILVIAALASLAAPALLAACAPMPPPRTMPEPPKGPYVDGPLIIGMKGIGPIRSTVYFEPPRIKDLLSRPCGMLFAHLIASGSYRITGY